MNHTSVRAVSGIVQRRIAVHVTKSDIAAMLKQDITDSGPASQMRSDRYPWRRACELPHNGLASQTCKVQGSVIPPVNCVQIATHGDERANCFIMAMMHCNV